MLEISGKVQWSILFLHHKTAIFIFKYKAYNDGLKHFDNIISDCRWERRQTVNRKILCMNFNVYSAGPSIRTGSYH